MAQKDEQQLASLYMKDGVVELKGFDMLKNSTRISFHLMPGGIVINNRDLPESPTCFTCECEADLKIKDKYLIMILKGRGYKEDKYAEFMYANSSNGGSYYEFEMHPLPQ